MIFVVDFFEVGVGDVSVDLGSTDVAVTEEGLDRAEVGAIHEKIGSKRVAEGMWSDMFGNAGETSIFFDNAFNRAGSETAKIARGVWGV